MKRHSLAYGEYHSQNTRNVNSQIIFDGFLENELCFFLCYACHTFLFNHRFKRIHANRIKCLLINTLTFSINHIKTSQNQVISSQMKREFNKLTSDLFIYLWCGDHILRLMNLNDSLKTWFKCNSIHSRLSTISATIIA